MASEVIDRDMGMQALVRELGSLGTPGVYVGILQDKGAEMTEDGITVAGYAAVNEFGSEDQRVPERSFMRSTVDDNQAEYQARLDEGVGAAIDAMVRSPASGAGQAALERHLGQLGARAARDIQDKIRDGGDPVIPNAPSTLARKYPANAPLRHTGRMRQSISFLVDMTGRERE